MLVAGLLVRRLSVIQIPESYSAAHAAPFENTDDLIEREELLSVLTVSIHGRGHSIARCDAMTAA